MLKGSGAPFRILAQVYGNTLFATLLLFAGLWHFARLEKGPDERPVLVERGTAERRVLLERERKIRAAVELGAEHAERAEAEATEGAVQMRRAQSHRFRYGAEGPPPL